MKDSSYDAIIVGAGIAGLTAAAYLCKGGYHVLLCEKNEKTGGLVSSFTQNGFTFDGGIRAFENSGIVFPMLRQLGIDMQFVRNPVSVGMEEERIRLEGKESLPAYSDMLKRKFPGDEDDIDRIIAQIKKTMKYMDVIYGIDNPLFVDYMEDKTYLYKTLLPWLLKYHLTMKKVKKQNEPVNRFLKKMTDNQMLIDMIAQHFFKETPAFFALSYFGLYLDYSYPVGGTGALIEKMQEMILSRNGEISLQTEITFIDVESRRVASKDGRTAGYKKLIWCADTKALYASVSLSGIRDAALQAKIKSQRQFVNGNRGGDSVLTVFLSVNLANSYFADKCGSHLFYTPQKKGLSSLDLNGWREIMPNPGLTGAGSTDAPPQWKSREDALSNWIRQYLFLTTYEISCPSLRDPALAPEGMTGVIASTLFDYDLVKSISDLGWYDDFKGLCEKIIPEVLDASIFPGFAVQIQNTLCSTPLTLQSLTGNSDGAITGWAFTNKVMPAVNVFPQIARSIRTLIPDTYQAGQWTFSPSGLPVSIMTGKMAANAVCKDLGLPGQEKKV